MKSTETSGPPDANTAAWLFVQLSPEGQRSILEAMRLIVGSPGALEARETGGGA